MNLLMRCVLMVFVCLSAEATVPLVNVPVEDFQYNCRIKISEQVGANITAAVLSFSVDKSQFHRGSFSYTTPSEGWAVVDDSKSLPKRLAGHQIFFEFGEAYPETDGRVFLYGRIRSGKLSSMSRASALFSSKENLDFYGNLADEKTILVLKIKCSR